MIRRRTLTAAAVASLLAPSISRGAAAAPLKFIPQSDLTILDPVVTTVYTARNHGFMVFDTLFGMNSQYHMEPQMLDGVSVEADGKIWKLTLREGLLWHDGDKVLARDCVASIRRWAVRDGIGTLLMARTDELSAADDRTIRFRLKKPFQMLPYALGKISTPMCAMMPERLAKSDPFKPITEMVGSGPFRFKADECLSGARAVYTKFDRYNPRPQVSTGWTAGGKIVHFERVEWITSPDDGTSASAMQAGEMDWWELPPVDLLPLLKGTGKIQVEIKDHNGTLGLLKMNNLQPPFDNPAIRRALLGAVVQKDFMSADRRRRSGDVADRCRDLHPWHRHGERCGHGGAEQSARPARRAGGDQSRPATTARKPCCCLPMTRPFARPWPTSPARCWCPPA